MTDMRLGRLTLDNGRVAEDLARVEGLFEKLGGVVETTTKRLTGTSREFQALARQTGVVTDAGAKIIRVFGEAQAAINKGSVSATDGARAMMKLADSVGVTADGLTDFITEARASKAALSTLTEGTKEFKDALAAHNQILTDSIQKQQQKRREDEEAARKAKEAADAALANGRAVQALTERMEPAVAAQNRFASAQQEVIDLFLSGALNSRQFGKAMEFVNTTLDPAGVAARKLAGEYQDLLAKYDPVRAAVRQHGQEVARATTILDKMNASEGERATVLKAVAAAYDPATRAANERAAALKKEAEAQAALMASYREQAALARSTAAGQGMWNAYAGVSTSSGRAAADSAAVFAPLVAKQELADEWDALIAIDGFAQQERLAQLKAGVAATWEAQLAQDAWGAAEAKAKLAAEWQGLLAVEDIAHKERVTLTKAAVAENWEAQIAMDSFASAEAKAKLAQSWDAMLSMEGFAQQERLAQLKHNAAQVMEAEMAMASFDAPEKYRRMVASYDDDARQALRYADALSQLRSAAAAAGIPADQLAAAEQRLAQSMSPAAIATKRQSDEFAELRRTIDPMGERLRDLDAKKRALDEAFSSGRLTGGKEEYDQLTAAYERHRLQLVRSTEAAEGFAGKIGLTRAQMTALAPQINDVVSGLAMGQQPMQILVQQGGQIIQALQAGGAEFTLFSGAAGVATLAVAATAVSLIALVAAMESYRNSINAVNDANRVMGDATGYTRGQLEMLAGSIDKVSTRSAREMEVAFIRAGNIVGDQFREAMVVARDFARVTGQEVPEAAKTLADLLKDPAKGAEAMRDSYKALTAAQAEYVHRLAAQGETSRAQQVQLDALKAKYRDFADEGVGYLSKAYHWLRTGVSDAWDAMGKVGAPASLDEQIRNIEGRIAKISSSIAKAKGQQPSDQDLRAIKGGDKLLDERDSLLGRKAAEEAVAAARSAASALEDRRRAGLAVSKQMETEVGQQNALNDQYQMLEKSVAAYAQQLQDLSQDGVGAAASAQLQASLSQVAEALDRVKNAKASYLTVAERTARADAIALTFATQFGQEAERRRAREQAELETAGQRLTSKEREAKVNSAVNQVIAQQTSAVTGQVMATDTATTSINLLTAAHGKNAAAVKDAELAQKIAQATLGMAPDLAGRVAKALTDQEMAQRRLNAAVNEANLRDQAADENRLAAAWTKGAAAAREAALANEVLAEARKQGLAPSSDGNQIRSLTQGALTREIAQRNAQFAQMAAEQRRAVELANAEWTLLGQSNATRAQQIAMLQTANDLRDKGVDLTDAGTRAYIRQAGELARVNAVLQEAGQNAANIAQPITTGLEDIIVGTKKVGEAAKVLGEDLKRIFARVTITKPFETLVTGELTKLLAGPVRPTANNTPRAANDAGMLDRLVGQVNRGLGSSETDAMWVRVAGRGAALEIDRLSKALGGSGAIPVAVKDAGDLEAVIQAAGQKYGLDANIIKGIIQQESSWNPQARNKSTGAAGLMQIMPVNVRAYGMSDAYDPIQNIDVGSRILKEHLVRAGGDLDRALSTYSGHVTTSGAAYVAAVKGSAAAYERAGSVARIATAADESGVRQQEALTQAQRAAVDAALNTAAANADAEKSIEVLPHALDKLGENAISLAETGKAAAATQAQSADLLAQASQQSAAVMVSGSQQAFGALLSIVGAASGVRGGGIPGQVIAAGGPQGISSSIQQLGSWAGQYGGQALKSLGIETGGIGNIMDAKLFTLPSWSHVTPAVASVAPASNGMLAGGEGASTGLGAQAAGTSFSVGNALSTVGYGFNAFQNFRQGNVVGGIGNTAAAAMMFIPGAQVFAPLVAIGSQLLGSFIGPKPSVGPNSSATLGTDAGNNFRSTGALADNGGSTDQVRQVADAVAGTLNQTLIAVGATNMQARDLPAIQYFEKDKKWYLQRSEGDRTEYGDSSALAAALVSETLQTILADGTTKWAHDDNPVAVQNVKNALKASVGKPVEQLVSNLQFAAQDFSKVFDQAGKAAPDQLGQQMAAMAAQFAQTKARAAELGVTTDGLADSFGRAATRMIDTAARAVQGLSFVDNALGAIASWRQTATALMSAGRDPKPATDLLGLQLAAVVNSVSPGIEGLEKLTQAAAILRSMGEDTAALFASTRADQVRAAVTEDLNLRQMQAQVQLGQVSQDAYDRAALEITQKRELATVTDAAVRAQLEQVQATERASLAAKQNAQAQADLAAKLQTGGTIRQWLDKMSGTAGVGVSPIEARDAAQAQFARDLSLARGGDADAYGRITSSAERLLSAQTALTASGVDTQATRKWVMASLENLPAVKGYDQQMLEELRKLGGSVNVKVELESVRVITEALNALPDAERNRLVQSQVVLRSVEERMGRFLTAAELGALVRSETVLHTVEQALGRTLTVSERAMLEQSGGVLQSVQQLLGRPLTEAERGQLLYTGAVAQAVQQSLGRTLTDAERSSLFYGGNVSQSVEQILGRSLTDGERAALVGSGSVLQSVQQSLGRTLTAGELAALVNGGPIVRTIGQYLGRDLSSAEWSNIVDAGAVVRTVGQYLGRDLTAAERDGIVSAGAVIRSVEQALGRPLTAAEQAQIILPGSVARTIGQQIDPATGAPLIGPGSVSRNVTQAVETTETVQISRSIDDKLSGLLAAIRDSSGTSATQLLSIGQLLYGVAVESQKIRWNTAQTAAALGGAPAYATGTDSHPGGPALVHAGELLIPNAPRGMQVLTRSETDALMLPARGARTGNDNGGAVVAELRALRTAYERSEKANTRLHQLVGILIEAVEAGNSELAATIREQIREAQTARRLEQQRGAA